jgi:DNA transposition AAA+ family ATPase
MMSVSPLPDAPAETARWAKLTNMDLCLRTMMAAIQAGDGAPRLAIFYGWSGLGKTVAAAYTAARTGAAYIQAQSVMTQKSFLEALCGELGLARPGRTATEMVNQIIANLQHDPRPLIFDEMDYLARDAMVGIIRSIHDAADIPILMIGEEGLPARLKQWERFDNRIIAATAAQPSDRADGRLLRDLYARRVRIDDDLVDYFVERTNGVTRRIVVNLQQAQNIAIDELDVDSLDRKAWGNRAVSDGSLVTRKSIRA